MKTKADPDFLPNVEDVLKEIGAKVRAQRKNNTKNYEEFAAENGFNKVTISRIENGENVTLSKLIEVLRVLNISLEDFFKGIK